MIRKFLSIILVCLCASASAQVVKPDFVRTPNGPNTIVDWNVKFKTMILPHYLLTARPTSQDTVGTLFLNINPSDPHIYIRGVAGTYYALANLSDVAGGTVVIESVISGVTPVTTSNAYSGYTNPTILFRDSSGNNYTPVNYQDTGTSVVVTSPDDGTGHSADTYTVIIKP